MYELFGQIFRKEYYVKKVQPKHFMRKYQGFGISCEVLGELTKMSIIFVLFIYTNAKGKKLYYLTSVKNFVNSKKTHVFLKDDKQSFVSVSDMAEVNPEDLFGKEDKK